MRELTSKAYRHVDWSTYGLYWLLRMPENFDCKKDAHIDVGVTTAYTVNRARSRGRSLMPINDFLTVPGRSESSILSVLKILSAGLRYSYLSVCEVDAVYISNRAPASAIFELADGRAIILTELAQHCLPSTGNIVLQSADPADWFNHAAWSQYQPLRSNARLGCDYPQSRPVFCDSQYTEALLGIGAKPLGDSHEWAPPLATANRDLRHYLVHHPHFSCVHQGA